MEGGIGGDAISENESQEWGLSVSSPLQDILGYRWGSTSRTRSGEGLDGERETQADGTRDDARSGLDAASGGIVGEVECDLLIGRSGASSDSSSVSCFRFRSRHRSA
ncbi:hypothetical protein PYCCODRAFT_1232370 [Trametes coccinea BRFM310]|uniref:Uncharacterized protein n=1 Tax=Trametes coccinea (strain BRFM310) TaxID=1353009 RepID=A0A1Y2IW90_TRAC3|nr:hypothetical protein PYCCODRAFT_1232370 [Trametes coccinea BRFM310]